MIKVIRLTESDLTRIVKRVISEQSNNENYFEVGEVVEIPIKSKPGIYITVKITKLVEDEPGSFTQEYVVINSNYDKEPKGSKFLFGTDYSNTYTLYTKEGREYQRGPIKEIKKL